MLLGELPHPTRPPALRRSVTPRGRGFPETTLCPATPYMGAARLSLTVHDVAGGSEQCCDPPTGAVPWIVPPVRFRCSRALSPSGEPESTPFAVAVPECRVRDRRSHTAGTSSLVAPPDPGSCEDDSKSRDGPGDKNGLLHGERERRRALLVSLPLARLALEGGGFAPCTATAETGE